MTGKRLVAILLWLGFLVMMVPALANENPWTIVINIPECKLYLYRNGGIYKTYKVAVGKIDSPSPIGEFRIINKVINPTWYPENGTVMPPGPKNPLGKYWMGLDNKGYGIHGNSAAWSIGAPASKGCFRLNNGAIKELFSLVPLGTIVKVTYNIVKCKIDNDNQAWLNIYADIYQRRNLEIEVQRVLAESEWDYQPHQKALLQLITAKKPLSIMVPRKIRIESEYEEAELDGFYWNDRVYLSRLYIESSFPPLINDDLVFSEFRFWDQTDMLGVTQKALKWNKSLNSLSIKNLKLLFNDEKIDQAGGFGSQGELLVNYSKIINWFEDNQLQKLKLITAMEEPGLSGKYFNGDLWVEVKMLTSNFKGFNYYYDENNLILFVYYYF